MKKYLRAGESFARVHSDLFSVQPDSLNMLGKYLKAEKSFVRVQSDLFSIPADPLNPRRTTKHVGKVPQSRWIVRQGAYHLISLQTNPQKLMKKYLEGRGKIC